MSSFSTATGRSFATARRLRESTERPLVAENERLCVHGSLAPVCLPEETRQAEHPEREALRLFPPDHDGTSLHVLTASSP
jgi:CRISPR-associated protein Cas1